MADMVARWRSSRAEPEAALAFLAPRWPGLRLARDPELEAVDGIYGGAAPANAVGLIPDNRVSFRTRGGTVDFVHGRW
jgi:hypothetical protein